MYFPVDSKLGALARAAAAGDLLKVSDLIDQRSSVKELDSVMGASPLHYAVQSGSIEIVKLLVSAGAFINLQSVSHGMTPLMVAVWHRKPELAAYLLDLPDINVEIRSYYSLKAEQIVGFGINGELRNKFDKEEKEKFSQLFYSYRKKISLKREKHPIFSVFYKSLSDKDIVKELSNTIKENVSYINDKLPNDCSGNDSHTPLLLAARDNMPELVKLLLSFGADQRITDGYMKSLPIHKAAYSGHHEVLRLLIKDKHIDEVLNKQGPFNGYTPLHDSVWHGHYEAAKVLIEAGASCDLIGYDGNRAEDLAEKFCYKKILNLLKK